MESINWTQEQMFEVVLKEPDDFLKDKRNTISYRCCFQKRKNYYINLVIYLHKQGRYYIVHFKELFALDGYKNTT